MCPPPPDPSVGPSIPACPRCQTPLPMEARFCGNCGHVLAEPAQPAVPAPAPDPGASMRRNLKQTMMGVAPTDLAPAPAGASTSSPAAPTAPAAPAAAPGRASPVRVAGASQTMIGMVSPVASGAIAPSAPGVPPAAAPAAAAPGAVGAAPASGGPARVANANRTMMGLVAPGVPSAPAGPAPGGAIPPAGAARPLAVANAQQTMVGVASPVAPPHPARTRSERPPMIGEPALGASPDAARLPPPPRVPGGDASVDDDALAIVRPRGPRPGVLLGVAGGALALVVAAAAALHFGSSSPAAPAPLAAEVQPGEHGSLSMVVTLPGMPAGTAVRYAGQSQQLDAQGRARFTLAGLGERVGAVELPLEVVTPAGETQHRTAHIVLAYRVEPDLSSLAAPQPALRLVFHVVPGSRLLINDQPVVTDPASGVGAATINNVAPIPAGTEALESPFRVQVTAPDGTVAQGVYQLRVPRTPLLVDRPGPAAVTAFDRVLVRGRATSAQRVTVGTTPATVADSAFTAVVPLPSAGANHLDVVAYSTVGAPASARLDVERVAPNDRAALARFAGSNPATVAQAAGASPPVGAHVRLRGRVLAPPMDREGAQTFQLVVADPSCPDGRCIFWVDTVPGTAPAQNATAEVAGTLVGRRQWSTTAGERRSDTVVDAAFIQ